MQTLEIPRDAWSATLDLVSESMELTSACLWLEEADGRCRAIARELPFSGISIDGRDTHTTPIEIALYAHDGGVALAHRVEAPARLWVGVADDGLLDGLLIEDRDERRTLLRFSAEQAAPGQRHLAFLSRFQRASF